jgi:hypothetical protein
VIKLTEHKPIGTGIAQTGAGQSKDDTHEQIILTRRHFKMKERGAFY